MHSLRARLFALWLLLVVSAAATAFLIYEFYVQSADVQLARTEIETARACRDIADRYAFFATGWSGPGSAGIDERLRRELTDVVNAALARASGIEGGLWQDGPGSLAYGFPTYEGSGPKTDLPVAELASIAQVNADALRDGRLRMVERAGRSQTLVLQACPVSGPIRDLTAWTMARVYTGQNPGYRNLLIGLGLLAGIVIVSALFLGRMLLTYSARISGLERALASADGGGDLPELPRTGERELDRLVSALNQAGARLTDARSRLVATERLAALGSMAAGIAHEIRNPMAAMRLKAENALATGDPARGRAALAVILDQVARLDALLGDLLGLTQPRTLRREPADVAGLVADVVRLHADAASRDGVRVETISDLAPRDRPSLDGAQIERALSNLLLNALQATAGIAGALVTIRIACIPAPAGDRLRITVSDNGPGIPQEARERVFEPFETSRAAGSGLGLSIVREIARAHGGDVHLAGSEGGGATFVLEVPWPRS